MLQEIVALFHYCRTVWEQSILLWSLHHLAIERSYTIPFTQQREAGGYGVIQNETQFPFVKASRKILLLNMQKSSSCTEVLHLSLVINFPFCPMSHFINDNAVIDDWCLLNTLLPNRQQRSCSNRYMAEGTSATGRWAHLFLSKGLNPAHGRIFTSQLICLWWYLWKGLQSSHNKWERPL